MTESTETTSTRHAARIGEAFEIALASNPSTGYRWEIDRAASAGLELVGVDELPDAAPTARGDGPPLVGAPGKQRWRVTARRSGSAKLTLIYRRAWEPTPPIKRHTASINIGN